MQFTTVLAFIAAATVVSASTNAERLARGMPLKAPFRRGTATSPYKGTPSGTTSMCSTGPTYCCNSIQKSGSSDEIDGLLALLGLTLPVGTSVGANCSPITVIGLGGNSCTSQVACCENNNYNGLVNIGCTPISIGL